MMGYYYAQNEANEAYKGTSYIDQTMQMLPSIVYSFVVIPLNLVYKVAAIKLTNWGLLYFLFYLSLLFNELTRISIKIMIITKFREPPHRKLLRKQFDN
jgi:hypothetical protein